jgi:hypothetical protein
MNDPSAASASSGLNAFITVLFTVTSKKIMFVNSGHEHESSDEMLVEMEPRSFDSEPTVAVFPIAIVLFLLLFIRVSHRKWILRFLLFFVCFADFDLSRLGDNLVILFGAGRFFTDCLVSDMDIMSQLLHFLFSVVFR